MQSHRVCFSCFSNQDLRDWIREHDGPRGCSFCGKYDSSTVEFHKLVSRIEECLRRYYGRAVDQLGYCTEEGGYLGEHWDSWDMLDLIGLELPRDDDSSLNTAIASDMTDEPWCDYDAGALNLDDALWSSWENFCQTVKHRRRFFFHNSGSDSHDSFTPASLLSTIAGASENLGLVVELPSGLGLWRARTDVTKGKRVGASDFGPPPVEFAQQSNRMNPAGISMLYLASSKSTALKETRKDQAKVGLWRSKRPLRVLDLRSLPPVPTIFSDEVRGLKLTLSFLHEFTNDIMKPVERDNKVHIDYLPSQVVSEFMRDFAFAAGALDGIAYGSTVHQRGWNLAVFLDPTELGLETVEWGITPPPVFSFEKAIWASCA